MAFQRSAGVLLHPTSLPGPDGVGDLGPQAYRWIDWLASTGCALWQVLPLGPTGYGDSPYQCFSAFAGNPFLVSPELLQQDGLLTNDDLGDRPEFPAEQVDFGPVIHWKLKLLDRAYEHYLADPAPLQAQFKTFQTQEYAWLSDFALFMSIKEANGGVAWEHWPEPLRKRDPQALQEARHSEAVQRHAFRQFLFFKQWNAVREYAHAHGITIIGDIPIFVAFDSADAWSHPELFYLDEEHKPTIVAGVPPDYFSPTGQLWGNPLYRWEAHAQSGYTWWIDRMRATLSQVDIIRLDHFRGFAGYWAVPYGNPTAEVGEWRPGPGQQFLWALKQALGDLPIIAEDLGLITPDVIELRDALNLPGMRIFQFGFSSTSQDPFLPHNYVRNCVAYTGTHDNDTVLGWYKTAPKTEQELARKYLNATARNLPWAMIRSLWTSVANTVVAPMQDLLSLGTEARMNFPGKFGGNWSWRVVPDQLSDELRDKLLEFNTIYGRVPSK
jgi:4-alpha-glucanotransferase